MEEEEQDETVESTLLRREDAGEDAKLERAGEGQGKRPAKEGVPGKPYAAVEEQPASSNDE